MDFKFQYSIEEDVSELVHFYDEQKWNAIEQHPNWFRSVDPTKKICFFQASENGEIVCSAIIEENKNISITHANIQFGPLFSEANSLVKSIAQICDYYNKKGFAFVSVQLGFETGASADYIEYQIAKIRKHKYFYNNENWSSIRIGLHQTEEEIFRNLSKGHKSDVKKAQKSGLTVVENFTSSEFSAFVDVYSRMHKARLLPEHQDGSAAYLERVNVFFRNFEAGKFLLVKDAQDTIVGGIAVVYQNKTVRYYKGAADPDRRALPILHLALTSAISSSKLAGYDYFDLWGYNHFATENDQIFFINRFKKGFGGDFIFYPKKMYFIFNGLKFKTLSTIRKIYTRYIKNKR